MIRKIKYEIEEQRHGVYPSTRAIKIDWNYLWWWCPYCGGISTFEFPTKESAENYLKKMTELVAENLPDLLKQIEEWHNELQISSEQ